MLLFDHFFVGISHIIAINRNIRPSYVQENLLECQYRSVLNASVIWRRLAGWNRYVPIAESSYFNATTLRITNLQMTDSGNYNCLVTNPSGSVNKGVYVIIKGKFNSNVYLFIATCVASIDNDHNIGSSNF